MSNTPLIIECLLKRKGGSLVTMADGTEYHFAPNLKDRHVAVVANDDHAHRLLSISEGYRLVGAVPQEPSAPQVVEPEANVEPAPIVSPAPDLADGNIPAPTAPASISGLVLTDDTPIETIREVFEAEVGRKPSPRAKAETLIAQIEAVREEKQGRA